MMVLAHSCDPFVGQFSDNYSEFLTGSFIGSAMRACVPLFVMVSAVLLLPVEMPMETFYKRRLTKIVTPLIFWSLITPVAYLLYMTNVATVSPVVDAASFTTETMLNKLAFFPLNFNYDTTPLWYLFMFVGLYLIMPIISDWLKNASQKTLKIFLALWTVTLVLPYVKLIAPHIGYQGVWGNFGILGECVWNPYGTFYYFSGFLGYAVLAFYIKKFPPTWSLTKTLAITTPMWLVGYAITLGGFVYIQKFHPSDYEFLEIFWYFCSINTVLMTTALFIIITKIRWKESRFAKYLASLTFGIYLAHFLLVQAGYDIFYSFNLPAIVQIGLVFVFSFVVTAVLVAVLKKLPKSKFIIG